MFNNKMYDRLKWISLVGLPAFGVLYLGLAAVWGLPKADEVNQTIILVCAFLGTVLGISAIRYNNSDRKYDGDIYVEQQEDGTKVFDMQLRHLEDPTVLSEQKDVKFKVNKTLPGNDG